ncbi:MAG: FtsW/RodA/SpoVE family cell cycle protein, partial [Patescibacteria group bacterium]
LVLFLGTPVRGTRAWFELFGFSLQPSELIKVIMILTLAQYFSSASYKTNQLKHFAATGLLIFLPIALILFQPDFGSAMIIFLFWLGTAAVFGLNRKQIFLIALTTLVFFTFSFFFLLKDYQKERVLTFLNPNISSLGKGYNAAQSVIAVGAGKIFGKGLGFGSQSQLKFLPESQTDFIFAVVGEEMGLIGVGLLFVCFAALFFRLIYWVKHIDNNFGLYIILGAIILLSIEMFINIGMNIGILPVVGITLPFLSYGGSSLIASLILIGIVESVVIHARHN